MSEDKEAFGLVGHRLIVGRTSAGKASFVNDVLLTGHATVFSPQSDLGNIYERLRLTNKEWREIQARQNAVKPSASGLLSKLMGRL